MVSRRTHECRIRTVAVVGWKSHQMYKRGCTGLHPNLLKDSLKHLPSASHCTTSSQPTMQPRENKQARLLLPSTTLLLWTTTRSFDALRISTWMAWRSLDGRAQGLASLNLNTASKDLW